MAADLVSQLQENLNILLSQYISAVGTLQRDAGPVSLRGEQVMPSAEQQTSQPEAPSSQQISEFAQQIANTSKSISGLVQQLPDVTQSEEEQLQGIAQLQVEQEEVKAAYRAARLQLEDKLAQVTFSIYLPHVFHSVAASTDKCPLLLRRCSRHLAPWLIGSCNTQSSPLDDAIT